MLRERFVCWCVRERWQQERPEFGHDLGERVEAAQLIASGEGAPVRLRSFIAGERFGESVNFTVGLAAMPSLHTAYATLAAGFFWFSVRRWWQKVLLACYPLAMGFALLYGGEHYLVDEIAGVAYSLVILAAWRLGSRVRGTRTRRPEGGLRESTAELAKL